MPRKGANSTRPNQQAILVPQRMRSQLARAPSSKAIVNFKQGEEDYMEAEDEEVGVEGDVEDDSSMVDMLNIIQEFQKRKANKSSARSVAFQNEKAALFSAARKRSGIVVKGGIGSIEKARAIVADLKANEISQEASMSKLKVLSEHQDECMQSLIGHLTGVIEDLSHRRAAQINESSAMLESHAIAREKSRRKLIKHANARITENVENRKLAADATALIKNYKALLLS